MGRVAFAAALAACVSVCGGASAADLSFKDAPEFSARPLAWTGFYIGGSIGGANTSAEVGDTFDYDGDPFKSTDLDNTGLITGVQLGYNYQRGNAVFGIEAGLGYLDIASSTSTALPRAPGSDFDLNAKYTIEGGLYGELTGRVGYATGNTLLYAKGGAAFLNADFKSDYVGENCSTNGGRGCGPSNPSTFSFKDSETLLGWTVGVGVEYALSSNWSLKAEYQHFDFGTQSFGYSGEYVFNSKGYKSKLTGDTDVDYTVDAVKVGVNYRFNGDEDAMK